MAFDWGRHRLPRLPDTWTFGDESFDATRRAIYGHLRDFANAAEDTRRALVDATDALRRATIGSSSGGDGGWVESNAKNVRDAVSSMTAVATHLREHLRLNGANVDALRRTLDEAVQAVRHAVQGAEHDAAEEIAKLLNAEVPSSTRSWTRRPRSSPTRRMSASTSRPRRGGRCTRSSRGRSRASG